MEETIITDEKKVENNSTKENVLVAALSYIPYVGWLVGLILHSMAKPEKKTELGAFHIRQTLGISVAASVAATLSSMFFLVFPLYITLEVGIFIFAIVLYVIGFIGALKGEKNPIMLIGKMAQKFFSAIH